MDAAIVQKIKDTTLKSFVSDDYLLEHLTLKGGNALDMIYGIVTRGSKDFDFSLENDFDDLEEVEERIKKTLEQTFLEEGYVVIDYVFKVKPKEISVDLSNFWGGYGVEFKLVTQEIFEKEIQITDNDKRKVRLARRAMPFGKGGSTKVEVDISKYEYVGYRVKETFQGLNIYVYAPIVILLEKVRAICQQMNEYNDIVKRNRGNLSGRARDFYDIYSIIEHDDSIDIYSEESQEIIKKYSKLSVFPLII
jgi:hypothetical protein